jgi:phenylalanyl-tRNA synthetase beta chain
MLISRDWLNEYAAIPKSFSAQDLASKLTLTVVEVEGWQEEGGMLENIVVGKILKIDKHPNADKLKICLTDIGAEKLSIVCGGANIRVGMLVAVAKVGAKVRWHGEGDWQALQPANIRGVESRGMICAAEEMGLPERLNPEHGILDLSETGAKPGAAFRSVMKLHDTIFEVDNKSLTHRPDLWGHYGLAREMSAIFGGKLKTIELQKITKTKKKAQNKKLKVKVLDSNLCPRYCGLVIGNIKVAPSPLWLQKRLFSLGVRPINNIVDVTNYVLLELGQPMHAFDYLFIGDVGITVRTAKEGEKITTIDDIERKLGKETLVIANDKGPVAVAGVMGGKNSEINVGTTTIILESANFEPYSIRKTSSKLGLRSESSIRFEKSLDPNLAPAGILRAAKLILDLCPGAVVASALVDVAKFSLKQGPIKLDLARLEKALGLKIPKAKVVSILKGLGFGVSGAKILSVKIPSWRATKDIASAEDLAEEILRIYGYDKVKSALPEFEITPPPQDPLPILESKIKDAMVGLGTSEVYNYSFLSERNMNLLGLADSFVKIKNPISKEENILRPNMLANLLKNAAANQFNFSDFTVFEIGSVYLNKPSKTIANPKKKTYLPEEKRRLAAVLVKEGSKNQFTQAQALAQNLFFGLGLNVEFKKVPDPKPYEHPARTAYIMVGDKPVGKVFELHPAKADDFNIKERVGYFEIKIEELPELIKSQGVKFAPPPKFPSVRRDLALVCPEAMDYQGLEQAIMAASRLVVSVSLFDIYRGAGIPAGTKSVALHLEFRHPDKTLEAGEIEKEVERILSRLKGQGIEIRK